MSGDIGIQLAPCRHDGDLVPKQMKALQCVWGEGGKEGGGRMEQHQQASAHSMRKTGVRWGGEGGASQL